MKYWLLCAVFLGSLTAPAAQSGVGSEEDWKLRSKEDRMEIFTRQGEDKLLEVRIKLDLKASAERLLEVLDDFPNYPEWVYRCSAARRVDKPGEKGYYYYSEVNLPYPFSDRDVVARIHQTGSLQSKEIVRKAIAAPEAIAPRKGVERIRRYEAIWKIYPQPDKTVKVDYFVVSDPGGNLPTWVVNEVAASGPVKSMRKLMAIVESGN